MSFLDVRTVILSQVLTDAICTLVLALLWNQDRKRYKGLDLFLSDFLFQTIAVLLIILRGRIPDWLSIGFSNGFIIAGALLGYIGLMYFVGAKVTQILNYLLMAIFGAVHIYFAFIHPSLEARDLTIAIGLLVICGQCVWLILHKASQGFLKIGLSVALVFALFCLVSIARIGVILIHPPTNNDFFQSGAYDTITLMAYQGLLILLAFSLALMVNHRLLLDMKTEEYKYSRVFHFSPFAITLTRPTDGKILEVNEGFSNITGYSVDEVLGRTTVDLQLWANEIDHTLALRDISNNIRIENREILFRKKSGELLAGLFSAEQIMIEDQPLILSTITDISERKNAEKEVEELARFPEENPNPVLRISSKGIILFANAAAQPILAAWQSQVGRLVPQKWKTLVVKSLKSKTHHQIEFRYGTRDYNFAISPFPIMNYVNVYARDITKRKQVEETLARERNLLRTMIDNIPDRIYVMDNLGRKTMSNTADWQACGVKKMEDVIGKTDFDTYPDEMAEEFWKLDKSVIDTGLPVFNFEERGYDSKGKPVWVLTTKVPLHNNEGEVIGLVGIGRDITERKKTSEDLVASQRAALNMMEDAVEAKESLEKVNLDLHREIKERRKAENEIRKLNVELEHRVQERTSELATANKELEAFSYSVSHDLRTPLRSMTGFSEALLEEFPEILDPKVKDYLHRISDAAHRMGRLVDDLLRLSRVTRAEIKKVHINLSRLAEEVAGELQSSAPERDVRWVIAPNLFTDADPELMKIVFSNLLGNAWKFTGKRDHAIIEFGCKKYENELLYFVKDNGAGFDPLYTSKIFVPFQRLHKREDFDGEGIGLSLVQRIIQRHGGTIRAEAKLDEGATFNFSLP
jgi:PAS domain S-box-containing protein